MRDVPYLRNLAAVQINMLDPTEIDLISGEDNSMKYRRVDEPDASSRRARFPKETFFKNVGAAVPVPPVRPENNYNLCLYYGTARRNRLARSLRGLMRSSVSNSPRALTEAPIST